MLTTPETGVWLSALISLPGTQQDRQKPDQLSVLIFISLSNSGSKVFLILRLTVIILLSFGALLAERTCVHSHVSVNKRVTRITQGLSN